MIGFSQISTNQYNVLDTVILIDKMDYMEGFDLTFKSLTTIKKTSFYSDYKIKKIATDTKLQDVFIVFDNIGWKNSSIAWNEMKKGDKYVISYYLKKYKRDFFNDITWGSEIVLGNHILEVIKLD